MPRDSDQQRSKGTAQGHHAMPEVDFDAEHDPARARRVSNMLLRRQQAAIHQDKSQEPARGGGRAGEQEGEAANPDPGDLRARIHAVVVMAEGRQRVLDHARPRQIRKLLPEVAREITADLLRLKPLVVAASSAETITPLTNEFERFHRVMHRLSFYGRRDHVPLHESGLEAMFDTYDIVLAKAGEPAESLANAYYDGIVESPRPSSPQAESYGPGAGQLEQELVKGGGVHAAEAIPVTRDHLVEQVEGFATDLGGALNSGWTAAASIITEPPPVEHPGKLEMLAEIAAGFVLGGAGAIVGKLIDKGFEAAEGLADSTIGSTVAGILKETFTDTAKDAMKVVGKPEKGNKTEPHETTSHPTNQPEDNSKLSPKTKFLMKAQTRTAAAISATKGRFTQHEDALKRVPIETLQALLRAFTPDLSTQIRAAYCATLIREWVNFTKAIGDDEVQPGGKLANMIDPVGVLKIRVKIDGQLNDLADMRANRIDGLKLESATIRGVAPAVIENLRHQHFTLGSLPVARHIVCSMNDQLSDICFDISRSGQLNIPFLPADARALLAMIARAPVADAGATDGQVMFGASCVLGYLSTLPADRIEDRG